MKTLIALIGILGVLTSAAFAESSIRKPSGVTFDYSNSSICITDRELQETVTEAQKAQKELLGRKGAGADYLGWITLPSDIPESLISDIEKTAQKIRNEGDALIVIGIGGSYLGAKAAVSAINGPYANELAIQEIKKPAVYFAGCDMSSDSLAMLLEVIRSRKTFVNVISKSGTTTEPAAALRIIADAVKQSAGKEYKNRIIATTDAKKGALRQLAEKEGWKTFVVPDDVGGRFSVLTPVGLLPIAAAGIDIRQMLDGAKTAQKDASCVSSKNNMPLMYAAVRNALRKNGKKIEILADFDPNLHYFGEWWKQLYGESEGKENKGIYPDSLDYSTDLHSMGQYVQDGDRILMETFVYAEKSCNRIEIPKWTEDLDGLGYLEGKTMDYIASTALKATEEAHKDGGVPNMRFTVPEMNAYYLGYMFYTFEYACGISGYMLGVNPFNQPGVEAYKKNMFRLMGKPVKK